MWVRGAGERRGLGMATAGTGCVALCCVQSVRPVSRTIYHVPAPSSLFVGCRPLPNTPHSPGAAAHCYLHVLLAAHILDCTQLAHVPLPPSPALHPSSQVLLRKFNLAYWRSPGYNFVRMAMTFTTR